jgi:hypothetical protein
MKQLDELDTILAGLSIYADPVITVEEVFAIDPSMAKAKQAIQALIEDIIGEDYPKDYPYDDPEAIKYFNIEKERQRAKLKELKGE